MPLRILLVEDDAVISALLAELLMECGYHVCGTATTEMAAVAAAVRLGPDLMIVDVHLEAGNGIAAMAAILQCTAMPHLFMTGSAREAFPVSTTVLLKPFGKERLLAALERVMGQSAAPAPGTTLAGPHPAARVPAARSTDRPE